MDNNIIISLMMGFWVMPSIILVMLFVVEKTKDKIRKEKFFVDNKEFWKCVFVCCMPIFSFCGFVYLVIIAFKDILDNDF
jgi:hypothetical protein